VKSSWAKDNHGAARLQMKYEQVPKTGSKNHAWFCVGAKHSLSFSANDFALNYFVISFFRWPFFYPLE
jgi:hypothetical protein